MDSREVSVDFGLTCCLDSLAALQVIHGAINLSSKQGVEICPNLLKVSNCTLCSDVCQHEGRDIKIFDDNFLYVNVDDSYWSPNFVKHNNPFGILFGIHRC